MSFYLQLFFESFGSSLLVPFSGQHVFFAMRAFGGYDLTKAAALAIAGGCLAQAVNYAVGGFMLYLKQQGQVAVSEAVYARIVKLANGWCLPLLLLSALPFGALLTVAAGFLGVPLKKAVPLLLLGQAGYWIVMVIGNW